VCNNIEFGPLSVQFKTEINDAFLLEILPSLKGGDSYWLTR
jgi:hypothetical protein